MRTSSFVGFLGISLLASGALLGGSIAVGCTDENYRPTAKADASPKGDAVDGAADPGPEGERDASSDAGPTPEGKARVAVFVAGNHLGVVSLIAPTPPSDAGDAGDAAASAADASDADAGTPVMLTDEDSVIQATNGRGFVLERGLGKVHLLDTADPTKLAADVLHLSSPSAVPYSTHPRAVLAASPTRAFIASRGLNHIDVVDIPTMTKVRTLVLRPYLEGDPDGTVDAEAAVYDAEKNALYVLLQRIDRTDTSGPASDGPAKCTGRNALIVGFNATSGEEIDINGTEAENALAIQGEHPTMMVGDLSSSRRLIVLSQGCTRESDAGPELTGRGIEAIDLASGAKSWLYQPKATLTERLSSLVWVDGTTAYVKLGSDWWLWRPNTTSLNSVQDDFPSAPVYAGGGRILGLAVLPGGPDKGGLSVVAFDVTSNERTRIAPNPFGTAVQTLPAHVSAAVLP